jgi:hypothetical protein
VRITSVLHTKAIVNLSLTKTQARSLLACALWTVFAVLCGQSAFAQGIQYVPITLDIPADGGRLVTPLDLNDNGTVLGNAVLPDAKGTMFLVKLPGFKTVSTFNCANLAYTETIGFSINNRGDVVGYCSLGPLGTDPIHGFLRDEAGRIVFLDFPGATQTVPTGVSNNRLVVGLYYGPPDFTRSGLYRIHGFKWDSGVFATIDLPLPDTYTILHSVNARGQITGEFTRFNPQTNATLRHGWFVYDKGQFFSPFPDSLEWMGGPAITLSDINDAGQIVGIKSNGGSAWNGPFLYDHSNFFRIALPPDFESPQVYGMNNRGEIVGVYQRKERWDPYYQVWLYSTHGFAAIPSPRGL